METVIMQLGDIVDIKGGGTPDRSNPKYWGGDIPWATVKDFTSNVLAETQENISELGVKNSATNIIPAGTIVVPTRMAVGKAAITSIDMAINQDLKALIIRNRKEVDRQYLMRYLLVKSTQLVSMAKGATVKGITLDVLREMKIPLPLLKEQKRIAAILDKADAIRRKRQQAIQLADQFLRAVFLDMFGDPLTNPMKWEIRPLGELADNQDGKRVPVKASDRSSIKGEYPYYGASGIIDYVDSYIFEGRHLLIGEDGANLLARSTPIAFIASGKYWVNNHAHVLADNGQARLEYLEYSINMRPIDDFVTGSAQPKLNQAMLNRIPVQVPPIKMQERFVHILEKCMSVNTIKKESASCADEFFNSCSQNAFSGVL
jgi:type I restriction enzyme S subunit